MSFDAFLPRVSPMVLMVRVSRSRVCVRLDSTMARWGRQSPHFSSPQHCMKTTHIFTWKAIERHRVTHHENTHLEPLLRSNTEEYGGAKKREKLTVAEAGILPDISWYTVCRGSLMGRLLANLHRTGHTH